MPLLRDFVNKIKGPGPHDRVQFPPVRKEEARDGGDYGTWIRNHRWTSRNEEWCKKQMETLTYKPTISILMQCLNPREQYLRESFSSVFNQIYPFHEFFVVDRGSVNPGIKSLLDEIEKDPRVKVSFQKGEARDITAIAKIMKKTESEWILLMEAEDILEPYALYNMITAVQDVNEIDFIFSDSDLIDDAGRRYAPQFKPVWAVGAHYPLGYYQHPIMMHGRLVKKMTGHEKISELMEQGSLLDDASNHSRWVIKAPGILYHARGRGAKNETPPEPEVNVLMNDNLIETPEGVRIDPNARIRTEPSVPLKLLWIIHSLELNEENAMVFHYARFLHEHKKYTIQCLATADGSLKQAYSGIGKIEVLDPASVASWISQNSSGYDVAFVNSDRSIQAAEALKSTTLPFVWRIQDRVAPQSLQHVAEAAATLLFPTAKIAEHYAEIDARGVGRLLITAPDMVGMKLFKQRNGPGQIRDKYGIRKDEIVVTIVGPTIPEKNQMMFVDAAVQIAKTKSETPLRFVIAGAREGEYLNAVKKKIEESDHGEKFLFIPEPANPLESYPFFWMSDICAFCSENQETPLALLEAMGFQKPVVAPDVYPANKIVIDGENGILYPANGEEAFTSACLELISNPMLRDVFGRKSQELAREIYSLKKISVLLETYLRESIVLEA